MASRFLSPAYEVMASAASPVINFGRGILGYQDPFLTQTMQDRMLELEAQKGPSGSIGYEDYGLPVSAPGGRFTGGLPSLLLSNPIDFGLAGSVGRYGYGPDGRTGLKYDFTPDQDTGSTGSGILDFINRGGVKNYISNLDLIGNFGFGTPAAASEVSIGEPNETQDFLETSTPTEISIPEAPKVFSPTQNYNFLPSAYEDETLGEDVGSTKSKFGIENLLEKALGFAVPGLSFLQNIAGGGQPYEQFTPGGTIRNGIYSIDGVNVPVSSFGGDFYNENTGLNRFDRAAERFKQTGSLKDLFASSRTGKEFFEKRRQIQAQKQKKLEDATKAKIKFKQYTGGGGGGGSYTPSVSASQAAANRESRRGGQYR